MTEDESRDKIMYYLKNGDLGKVKDMIEAGELDVNSSINCLGETLLHVALKQSKGGYFYKIVGVKLLVEAGADLNVQGEGGKTALMFADHEKIAKYLIEAGADVNIADDNGDTALVYFSEQKHFDCGYDTIKMLIEAGAELNRRDCCNGNTALIYWSQKRCGGSDIVKLLVKAGADMDVQGEGGKTALMVAGDPETAQYLIESGADIHVADNNGDTALIHFARKTGGFLIDPEIVKMLVNAGADLDVQGKGGKTALMVTAETDYWYEKEEKDEVARYLIESGVDIRQVDDNGDTALIHFVRRNNQKMTSLLLHLDREVYFDPEEDTWTEFSSSGKIMKKFISHMLYHENLGL